MTRFQTHVGRLFSRYARAAALATTLCIVAVLFGFASAAQASGTSWAWTESKARQMVARKALVKVPAPLRATLASELLAGVRLYSGLEMAATEVGDVNALATYQHLRARYRSALETLRNGLQIQSAACTGLGVAVSGNRFSRFRCPVTSVPLEIPTVELDFEDRVLPEAVEGSPRIEGPFQALLDIRVTGKSAITYRQLR
jgi:hypothetical protein